MKENARAFDKVISDKMDDIVSLLDLFQGQLSLSDILNQDIPLIDDLRKAKNRLNGEINKETERMRQKALQQSKQEKR